MLQIHNEAKTFRLMQESRAEAARQNAAMFLLCGIDLQCALATAGEERQLLLQRVKRALERERLKGVRRHWSYSLNRHIALKQAFSRLSITSTDARTAHNENRPAKQKDGARKRRRWVKVTQRYTRENA